jgi:hypothetical protein
MEKIKKTVTKQKKGRGNAQNLKPYKKGQSGNPNGRPKGSRNFNTIIKEILELRLKDLNPNMNVPEHLKKKTNKEIMVMKQVSKAAAGNQRAFEYLVDRIDGKIMQPIDITDVTDLSEEEMEARLKRYA